MQKFYFDAYEDDTDYLNSIPSMAKKIISGMREPLAESVPTSEVVTFNFHKYAVKLGGTD